MGPMAQRRDNLRPQKSRSVILDLFSALPDDLLRHLANPRHRRIVTQWLMRMRPVGDRQGLPVVSIGYRYRQHRQRGGM